MRDNDSMMKCQDCNESKDNCTCTCQIVVASINLKPCLCGNFGDDGPDDYCLRPCENEDGSYKP